LALQEFIRDFDDCLMPRDSKTTRNSVTAHDTRDEVKANQPGSQGGF
jgi:hypothetical protein